MNKKNFTARTLDDCLELASSKLKIPKDDLKYKVTEDINKFFKKKVTILVEVEETLKSNKSGKISVKNGQVIVKDPKTDGMPATINPIDGMKVLVDGSEINKRSKVNENSFIELVFEENIAERRMNISIVPNKMKAYVSIKYIPQNVYMIEDSEPTDNLDIKVRTKEQIFPKPYNLEEINEQLSSNGIKAGIIEENLCKLTLLEDMNNILIAQGKECIDNTDDVIEIKFHINNEKKFSEDKEGKIDYKSIGYIKAVKKGEILAIRHEGKEGKDGIDVLGNIVKHKKGKKKKLVGGAGCEFKDEYTVMSAIEGKPSCKNNIVSVYELHEVEKDVDLKTGNIEFKGDIVVYGNVREGMKVNAGHNLTVNKNVERAKLHSKRDMEILGNIINSTLNSGGEDIIKLNKLKKLKKIKTSLVELIGTVEHIKKFNLLGKKVNDGEIIKVLMENKFKHIGQISSEFIKLICIESNDEEKKMGDLIKKKLIGFAPLKIKNVLEFNELIEKIEHHIKLIDGSLAVPVDMKISYCQDSILESSGNIIITGKGEYVSKITSYGDVEFTNIKSLARGGFIKSKNNIKCKNVGSEGGVLTKLIVEAKGHIWVDTAYQNTRFIVGGKEHTLEVPSKDIHAYLDNEGTLVVDKFLL